MYSHADEIESMDDPEQAVPPPANTCTPWATPWATWTNTRRSNATRSIRAASSGTSSTRPSTPPSPTAPASLRYGGDFGDRPSDYEFSGDGLLFADRKPSPKAQEVKQLYSNVHIDVTKDSVSVKNDNLFTAAGDYVFVLSVLADGKPVWQSTRRFDVARR